MDYLTDLQRLGSQLVALTPRGENKKVSQAELPHYTSEHIREDVDRIVRLKAATPSQQWLELWRTNLANYDIYLALRQKLQKVKDADVWEILQKSKESLDSVTVFIETGTGGLTLEDCAKAIAIVGDDSQIFYGLANNMRAVVREVKTAHEVLRQITDINTRIDAYLNSEFDDVRTSSPEKVQQSVNFLMDMIREQAPYLQRSPHFKRVAGYTEYLTAMHKVYTFVDTVPIQNLMKKEVISSKNDVQGCDFLLAKAQSLYKDVEKILGSRPIVRILENLILKLENLPIEVQQAQEQEHIVPVKKIVKRVKGNAEQQ